MLLFRTVGGGPESEYFSEGMTEDVIAALSSVPGLRVAARTSSFSFRSKSDDIRRIGAELGVATVLDGSVRQSGQRLRVTAQLIDVKTGYNLWSERWDRDFADVFAVQDELARAIAATLTSKSSSGPIAAASSNVASSPAKLVAPATRDVVAYDRFLKGRYFWNRRRLHESIAELEAAVERDPDRRSIHGAFRGVGRLGFYGGIPHLGELGARARRSGTRGGARAGFRIGTALPRRARALLRLEHRTRRAFLSTRDCTQSDERRSALLAGALRRHHGALGRGSRGRAQGVCLEPHSPNNRAAVGWPLHMVGRYEEAAAEFAAAVALGDSPFALWSHGTALSALGRHEQAIAVQRETVQLTGGRYSFYVALLASALAQGGHVEKARTILRELDELATREYVPPFDRALVLVSLGDDDAALDALERALRERNAFLWSRIYHFPQLRRLAPLPRFRAIADQLARRAPVKTGQNLQPIR